MTTNPLLRLRDAWIAAENARTEAYHAFMKANRTSPLRTEFDAAKRAEKLAKDEYAKALQSTNKNSIDDKIFIRDAKPLTAVEGHLPHF
jgi:hypothetical protein